MNKTLAFVVICGDIVSVHRKKEDAEWMKFMLGRKAKIKRFTSRTLSQLLKKSLRR